MLHRASRIGNICPDPRNRNVGLNLLEFPKGRAGLLDVPSLGKASNVDSMTSRHSVSLLYSLAPISSGFVIAPGQVMRSRKTHIEDRVLRILRAHTNCPLGINDCAV